MNATPSFRTPRWPDRLGMTASTACAIHCAITPVVLALAPSLGLAAWNERWESGILVFVTVLAILSLTWGTYCHRAFHAWWFLLTGLVLAWGAFAFLPEGWPHRLVMVAGGLGVASAHLINQRLTHRTRPCPGCAGTPEQIAAIGDRRCPD